MRKNKINAVCIYCGMIKNSPWTTCTRCHQTPKEEDLVKSVYYSTGRFADDQEAAEAYRGQLALIALDIENGVELQYDKIDIDRLKQEKHFVENTEVNIALLLFRLALPGLIFALLTALIIAIRYVLK
jgi:recombinational DNA repair protein RecR